MTYLDENILRQSEKTSFGEIRPQSKCMYLEERKWILVTALNRIRLHKNLTPSLES